MLGYLIDSAKSIAVDDHDLVEVLLLWSSFEILDSRSDPKPPYILHVWVDVVLFSACPSCIMLLRGEGESAREPRDWKSEIKLLNRTLNPRVSLLMRGAQAGKHAAIIEMHGSITDQIKQ